MNKKALIIIGALICLLFTIPMVSAAEAGSNNDVIGSYVNDDAVSIDSLASDIIDNGNSKIAGEKVLNSAETSDSNHLTDDIDNLTIIKNISNIDDDIEDNVINEKTKGDGTLAANALRNPDGTFSDLFDLIDQDTTGIVTLNDDYKFVSGADDDYINGIEITKSITIDGNGHTIDGSGLARIFWITPLDSSFIVKLNNLVLLNASTGANGGSIYIKTQDDAVTYLENITIKFSKALGNGGGIYLETPVSMKNITAINCTAGEDGGAIYAAADGQGSGTDIFNFYNNTAKNGGAVYTLGNNLKITEVDAQNNTATGYGGAIYAYGNHLTLDGIRFINNHAGVNPTDDSSGGAIYFDTSNDSIVNHVHFENNSATKNGGAIAWARGSYFGELYNSNFTNNSAGRSGGAVRWVGDNGTVENCSFVDNRANGTNRDPDDYYDDGLVKLGGNGGALIGLGSIFYLKNSNFTNNYAELNGGGVFFRTESDTDPCNDTHVINCTFTNNNAGCNGGAVGWNDRASYGSLADSVFINNTARRSGGAIFWKGNDGVITNCNFTNNSANGTNLVQPPDFLTTGGNGGAIIITGSNINISYSSFENNSAKFRGGAVYLQNNDNTLVLNSTFINNTAGTNGGALDFYHGASNGKVINSTFFNNTAKNSGGSIYWNGHFGVINGSIFRDNIALNGPIEGIEGQTNGDGDGGAIRWTGSHGVIENSTFINNTAMRRGGAIYLLADELAIAEERYCENVTVKNCTFEENIAGTNGGAIDWFKGARNGTVSDSRFINNTANRTGGAIFWNGINGTVKASNFTNNIAKGINEGVTPYETVTTGGDGGAIMWSGPNGLIELCNFDNNSAKWRGGAVFLQRYDDEILCENTTVSNSNFTNNYAGSNGGAIEWTLGARYGHLINSTFINNTAERSGGAVFWYGLYGEINGSEFINNTALGNYTPGSDNRPDVDYIEDGQYCGGAVYIRGDNTKLFNDTFLDNNATRQGGAVFIYGDNTFLDACNFTNHTAHEEGGAVYVNGVNTIIGNSTFTNNTSWDDGGAIAWSGDKGGIYNITCVNNSGISNGHTSSGGTISIYGSDLFMDRLNITEGYVVGSADRVSRGGAIFLTGNNVNITNSEFTNCSVNSTAAAGITQSAFDGGALYIIGNNTKLINASIIDCIAHSGGAVMWQGNGGYADNVTSIRNNGTEAGGAFYINGSNTIIGNSTFTNNTSWDDGGAIAWFGNSGILYNVTCENNTGISKGHSSSGGTFYIEGNDLTMDIINITNTYALKGGAIFITGSNTKIYNADISNSNATTGDAGAIYVIGNNVNITNSSVIDCHTPLDGGAIYISGTNATVDGSKFINNTAKVRGGAIFLIDNVDSKILNTYFESNHAGRNGGAIDFYKGAEDGLVSSCEFVNNTADSSGGSIFWEGTRGIIEYSNFTGSRAWGNNTESAANAPNKGRGGSVIWLGDRGEMRECIFNDSVSLNEGSALYIIGNDFAAYNSNFTNSVSNKSSGTIYIQGTYAKIGDCYMDNNTVKQRGAGIYVKGNFISISGTTISNSSSGDVASAVYVEGNRTEIKDSIISNNIANKSGAVYIAGSRSTVSNVDFENNTAKTSAGAIYISGDDTIITKSNFTNNTSPKGGAVLYEGQRITISYSNFDKNRAYGSGQDNKGGSISIKGRFGDSIIGCNFTDSSSASSGGSIHWLAGGEGGLIQNCTFINSSTDGITVTGAGHGGAIIWEKNTNGVIDNCTFINCEAKGTKNAGAIYMGTSGNPASNPVISNCTIINCTNGERGIINIYGINATLFNITFVNNSKETSTSDKGFHAIEFEQLTTGRILNCTFENMGGCYDAGAIKVDSGSNIVIANNTFINVTSTRNGGAILTSSVSGEQVLENNTFINCSAQGSGGAVYFNNKVTSFKNNTFINNTVLGTNSKGGAVFLLIEKIVIDNSSFIDNGGANQGGAVYSSKNLIINNSYFESNTADAGTGNIKGGALFTDAGGINVNNSTFIANSALHNGGALFANNNGAIYISNSTFEHNTAPMYDGGAIYTGGAAYINESSTFLYNNATRGSAIFAKALYMNDTVLLENQAHFRQWADQRNSASSTHVSINGTFRGEDTLLNAIYLDNDNYRFNNVTYCGENGEATNTDDVISPCSYNEVYQLIILEIYDEQNELIDTIEQYTDANGRYSFDFDLVDASNHAFKIYHPEDNYYTGAEYTISKALPIIEVQVNNITHPETEVINFTVSGSAGTPKGNLTVVVKDENETVIYDGLLNLTDLGTAHLPLEMLNVSHYNVTVRYNGDENYIPANTTVEFDVFKGDSYLSIEIDNYTYNETRNITIIIPYMEEGRLSVIVSNDEYTQLYTIYIEDTDSVKIELPILDANDYNVNAIFHGNNNYFPSENNINFTVFKAASIINVTADNVSAGVRAVVDIHIDPEVATQTIDVIVRDMDENIVAEYYGLALFNSRNSIALPVLEKGQYNVTVHYYGDKNHNESENSTLFTVSNDFFPIIIEADNLSYGEDQIINITVPANAIPEKLWIKLNWSENATVSSLGYEIDENGIIHIDTSDLAERLEVGNYTVDVYYECDDNYLSNSTSISFEVIKADADVIVTPEDIPYTDIEDIVIEVLPENAQSGTVNIYVTSDLDPSLNITVENVEIGEDGKVNWNVNNVILPVATYNIELIYSGNENYEGKTVTSKFEVYKAAPQILIDVNNIFVGEDEVINVTLVPAGEYGVSGNVTILVRTLNETIVLNASHQASLTLQNEVEGYGVTVIVMYNGDDNYNSTFASTHYNVTKRNTTTAITGQNPIPYGAIENLTINVNETAVTGTLTVFINSTANGFENFTKVFTLISDDLGEIEWNIDGMILPVGKYNITAFYLGDNKYEPSNASYLFEVSQNEDYEITVEANNTVYRNEQVIIVTVPDAANGTVTIVIEGTDIELTASVSGGKAIFVIPNDEFDYLEVHEDYRVIATYDGDDNYKAGVTGEDLFNVIKAESHINVIAQDIVYAQVENITVSLPETNASGRLVITITNKSSSTQVIVTRTIDEFTSADGVIYLFGDLAAGNYTVKVEFLDDHNYEDSEDTADFEVGKADASLSEISPDIVYGADETITVTITGVEGGLAPAGTVEVKVDGVTVDTIVIGDDLEYVISKPAVDPRHNVTVIYSGDNNYDPITIAGEFAVSQNDTYELEEDSPDIVYGVNETISITLPNDATGTVYLVVNGTYYTPIGIGTNHQAVFEIVAPLAGDYEFTAYYSGDSNYAEKDISGAFTVSKADIVLDESHTATITYGADNTITVTITGVEGPEGVLAPSGTIKVLVDNVEIGNQSIGTDSLVFTSVKPIADPEHNITVIYSGDANYNDAVLDSRSFEVIQNTDVEIREDSPDISYGENEIITVSIAGDATGTITVKIGDETVGTFTIDSNNITEDAKSFEFTKVKPDGGVYNDLVVEYGGDNNYAAKTITGEFTVSPIDPEITEDSPDIVYSDDETIVIAVPEGASGTLTVTVKDSEDKTVKEEVLTIGEDDLEVLIQKPDADNYTITIGYGGCDNYTAKSIVGEFEVIKASNEISVTPRNITYGETETITVSVPEGASGSVTITIGTYTDTKNIEDGASEVIFSIPKTEADALLKVNENYVVFAKYSGDSNFESAIANAPFHVDPAKTTTAIKVANISYGEDEIINVTVAGVENGDIPSGFVTLTIAGTDISITKRLDAQSKAQFNVSGLVVGEYTVNVQYESDTVNYNDSQASTKFNVTKSDVAEANRNITAINITYGDDETITVTLNENNITGKVTITIGGTEIETKDLENGKVVFVIPNALVNYLEANEYNVVANYSGDDNYNAIAIGENFSTDFKVDKASVNLEVSPMDIVYKQTEEINVTVTGVVIDDEAAGVAKYNLTGKVTIYIDDVENETKLISQAENGILHFSVDGLAVGKHNVTAKYWDDRNYNENNLTEDFNVANALPEDMEVIPQNITYHIETETVSIDLGEVLNGTLELYINDTLVQTIEVEDKQYIDSIAFENLPAGNYTAKAKFIANDDSVEVSAPFHVSPASPVITVEPVNISYGQVENITVTVDNELRDKFNLTGSVGIYINGKEIETKVISSDGRLIFNVPDLVAGDDYVVEAKYHSDANYINQSATAPFKVSKADVDDFTDGSDNNITALNITYGEDETITLSFSENNITGSVTIIIGDYTDTKLIDSGTAVFTVKDLEVNEYEVIASYSGDDNYNAKDGITTEFTVGKANSTVDVIAVPSIVYGNNGTITVTVPIRNHTGTITLTINGTDYVFIKDLTAEDGDSIVLTDVSGLAVGLYNVSVSYSGDRNYNDSVDSALFEVVKAAPSQISVVAQNITYTQDEIILVTVSDENASGTVVITVGDYISDPVELDENGQAKFNVTGLVVDYYTVEASYSGDLNYTGASASAQFIVDKAASDVTVDVDNITYGDIEYANISIPNYNSSGRVIIKLDGKAYDILPLDVNTPVNLELGDLAVGEHSIDVEYFDDANYNNSIASALFNVTKAVVPVDPEDSSSLIVVPTNITYLDDETIVVSVGVNNATGKVTILINGTEIESRNITEEHSQSVTFIVPDLAVGEYNVTVKYTDDANYEDAETNALFHVDNAASSVDLAVVNITYLDDETISVTFPITNASGTVVVKVNGSVVDERSVSGDCPEFTVTVSDLAVGEYNVTVEYSNDVNYNDSDSSAVFTVSKRNIGDVPDTEGITVVPTNITYLDDETIVVTVDVPNATGKVTILINGTEIESRNITEDGSQSVTFIVPDLAVGEYNVTVKYSDDANYNDAETSELFHVDKAASSVDLEVVNPIVYGNDETISVTVPITNASGTVVVKVNGTVIDERSVSGDSPEFTVIVSDLAVGEYNVTVEYYDDVNYNGSQASTLFNVTKAVIPVDPEDSSSLIVVPTNITYLDDETIVVSVGVNNATGKVTILINGTEIESRNITEEHSQSVTFIVPDLAVGEYNVTVKYSDDANYEDAESSALFHVDKAASSVTVSPVNITYLDDETITVTVPIVNASGSVVVKVNGSVVDERSVSGDCPEFTVTVSDLAVGEYNVTVEYYDDVNYNDSQASALFNVTKAIPSGISIIAENSTYGQIEHITVAVADRNATGNVTITILNGSENYTETIDINDGVAEFDVSGLPAKLDYIVIAQYNGDVNYEIGTVIEIFNVYKAATQTLIEVNNISYNENEIINLTVNGLNVLDFAQNPSMYLTLKVNDTVIVLIGELDDDANLSFNITGLVAGEYSVLANYTGDNNYNGSYVITSFTVGRADVGDFNNGTVPELENNITALNITYGENTTVTLEFSENNITGSVTIVIKDSEGNVVPIPSDLASKTISHGIVSFDIPDLAAGNYTVVASYGGDDNYNAKGDISTGFTVAKADSSIEIVPTDIDYGELETMELNITVSNASGKANVTIYDKDNNEVSSWIEDDIESGIRTISCPDILAGGNYTVTVCYYDDANYEDSSASAKFTVSPIEANLTEDSPDISYGLNEVIEIQLTENATGDLNLTVRGGNTYEAVPVEGEAGKYTVTIEKPDAGTYYFDIVYGGNENYTSKTISGEFDVSKATNATLEVVGGEFAYGDPAIVQINLTDGDAKLSGIVKLTIDGTDYYVDVVDGVGEISISGLSSGDHPIIAEFIGNDNYEKVINDSANIRVNASTDAVISAEVDDIVYGENATVNGTVVDGEGKLINGTVIITVDGNDPVEVNVTDGVFEYPIENLTAGNHTIVIGAVDYDADPVELNVEVDKAEAKINAENTNDAKYGEDAIIAIGLTDDEGNPINGTVILSVDGEEGFTVEVDAESVDEYLSNLTVGNHTVIISLVDDNYEADDVVLIVEIAKAASENVTITVSPSKEEFVYGEDATVDIEVTGLDGVPLDGIVVVTVNDVEYAINVTDGKGSLSIPNLDADDYPVKAVFAGNDEYESAVNEDAIIVVIKADPSLSGETGDVTYGEPVELKVNLTGNGEKLNEEVIVRLYDSEGVQIGDDIPLNLSEGNVISVPDLKAGYYYFVVSFEGNDNFNAIDSDQIPFTVNAADIGLNIVPASDDIVYGDEIPLIITVTGVDEPVDVLINVTDSDGNLIIEDAPLTVNGSNIFVIPDGYNAGDYNVTVVALAGDNHNGVANGTEIRINKAKAIIVHEINSTVYADKPILEILDVIGIYNESLSGLITVSYYDFDNETNRTYLRSIYGNATDGKLLLETQRFAAGQHELFISFENENYDSYPHEAIAIVEKMVPNLTATVKNITVGENASVKIEIRGYLDESINENITIYLNSEYYDTVKTVKAYNTTVLEGLDVGNYTVLVVYGGNENYTDTFYSVSFNVSKISGDKVNLALSVPQSQYSYGENATVDISLTGINNEPINGTVIVTVDGKDYTVDVVDGKASLNVSGLDAGKYPVVASFLGNHEYESADSKKNATIKVVAADNVEVTVSGGEYDYGMPATVSVNLSSDGAPLNGKVIVTINHTDYEVNVVGGIGSIDVYGLPSGEYPVSARYVGDNNHKPAGSNTDAKLIINPSKEAKITASVDDIVYGEDAMLEITVLDGEDKAVNTKVNVTVDGGEPIEVDVVKGKAVLPIEGLEQGKHNITISMADDKYDAEPANASLIVYPAEANVDLSTNDPEYGENATVSIDVYDKNGKPVNGTAKVTVGDKEFTVDVVDGKAIVDAGILDAGEYPVTVELISDNYEPVIQTTTLTVSKLDNAQVNVIANDIKQGETEEIEISLSDKDGNPISGIVKLTVDQTDYFANVTDGKATVSIEKLDAGNYTVDALFLGNNNYNAVSNSTGFIVKPLKDVAIDIVPGDGVVNISLIDEDGNPVSGPVNVTIDGETQEVELVDGKASIPVSDGTKVVTVNYPGDEDHAPANATKTIDVIKIIPTQVVITVENITYTQNATIDLGLKDIDGNPLSGVLPVTVDDKVYNVTIKDGIGSISIANLDAGNYTVVANYSGNAKYEPSFDVQDFNVRRVKTHFIFENMDTKTVELEVEGRIGEYFNAQLVDEFGNPLANRSVQIGFNGKVYNRTTNATGGFRLQVNLKHSANYTFALYHIEDNNYEAAFASARIQVLLQTPKFTVNIPSYKASAKTKTLTAKVVSIYGTPVKNRRVSFIVDGRYYSAYTNSKGVATVKVSLNKKGTYKVTANFEGDDCYKAITKTSTIKIT